jgi:outer membrane immunogenic protein
MKLKQHLLASALCVLPFAASAADLPMKAPPMRVVQPIPFTWTGFYIGASAGIISQNTTATDTSGAFFTAGDTYGVPGNSGLIGINIGYNYQFAPNWVIGIEADFAWSGLSNTGSVADGGFPSASSKLNSLGTVRGRIGYAFDRALLYATGGFAYGHVQNALNDVFDPAFGGSTSSTQTGWTAGGGLEYAFTNNWTARVEALYVDLGTSTSGVNNSGCTFGFKNRYTLGRLGLNYKF